MTDEDILASIYTDGEKALVKKRVDGTPTWFVCCGNKLVPLKDVVDAVDVLDRVLPIGDTQ